MTECVMSSEPTPSPLWSPTAEAFERLLARVAGRQALDIGANEGGYAALFLEKGASRVVALEPGPRLAAGLRQRFADRPEVTVRQVGISDRVGHLSGVKFHNCWTLARPGEFDNRLHAVSPGAEDVEGAGLFDVALTTVDEIVESAGLSDVGFIKIDVDGYEARVLRGARQTLTRQRPPIMIELSYLIHDLGDSVPAFINEIYSSGYVVVTMAGEVATAAQVLDGFPWHTSFDVLMLPAELARDSACPALK